MPPAPGLYDDFHNVLGDAVAGAIAVSFLSLFSLILLLAVYSITV